jgi:hypothetical protein
MSEQLWGQDIEQVRELARKFDRSAQNLDSARQLIDGAVYGFDGWGANVDQMRDMWSGDLAPSLTQIADALRGAGETATRNADEQQDTSESYDGGSAFAGASASGSAQVGNPFAGVTAEASGRIDDGGGVFDWLGDRASDVGGWFGDRASDIGDGFDWLGDRASDVGGWFSDTASTIGDSWSNLGETGGQLWDATGGSILDGRWPRTTEVVASQILFGAALVDTFITTNTAGQVDLNLFDDGSPWAGDPRPVDLDGPGGTYPQDIADITQSVTDAYQAGDGEVRITTIDTPDGPRVIVSIPGTETWNPVDQSNPMDFTGNLVTAGGGTSTMTESVMLAMENANIPPDAEVLIAGHSQGGMTAAALASDPDFVSQYNVTNLMTFGSPIDSVHIDPSVNVLEMQHASDLVPQLDMGDAGYIPGPGVVPFLPGAPIGQEQAGPGHTEAVFANPEGVAHYDILGNHSHQAYSVSIAEATDPANSAYNPSVAAYEQQLRDSGFLGAGNDSSNTSAVDIHIERKY